MKGVGAATRAKKSLSRSPFEKHLKHLCMSTAKSGLVSPLPAQESRTRILKSFVHARPLDWVRGV